MPRLAPLLLAGTLALWVLVVPMLHGHLPGAAAHLHGADLSATQGGVVHDADAPPLGDVVADPVSPLADEGAALPLATALALAVVVWPLGVQSFVHPRARRRRPPRPSRIRHRTPVARHEVIVV